jgi:hypothetical protein
VPELVTATGSDSLGGFTLFQVCAITPLSSQSNSPLTSTFIHPPVALGSETSPPARSANSTQSVARGASGPSLYEWR